MLANGNLTSVKTVRITPVGPVAGTIRPPGSKSITNRALVCAALADGTSRLKGVLNSEDTQVMIQAWRQLGLSVHHDPAFSSLEIVGCGGELPTRSAELFVGNSGTTIRFLTAALSACRGSFTLDGVDRMRQRPIGDLLRGLEQLGGTARSINSKFPDCPPVKIESQGLSGGLAVVAGNISSQFLSGLMLAAPLARRSVTLEVEGPLVSIPYVSMTAQVMRAFGASVSGDSSGPYVIESQHAYRAADYAIEPDASAASYFWAAAAITGGRARVEGLSKNSLQGDVRFCEVLRKMGCSIKYENDAVEVQGTGRLSGVDVNMADISDTVQTLAAVAVFADGPTTICGVAHNRVKETDRIADLAHELRKLGADVRELDDGLRICPPAQIRPAEIATYHDHRMAMSLALVGLRTSGIVIRDPDCTAKTYPEYWQDLANFTGSRIDASVS
ncbi:MAG: 3-phosphoshikimate 1-carboxyvinyltransferase [Pirellulaceae bacterium]|nr:3-phosphoshikimate 1-carboxyvinyltransferase [Pirellulaceae bacterium]